MKIYENLVAQCRNLDKPNQVSEDYVLARVYKFVLFKEGKL